MVQDVADPHLPDPRPQRIQTTAGVLVAATDRTDGEDDLIIGSGADDLIFGGNGNDVIDAGNGDNLVVGDHGYYVHFVGLTPEWSILPVDITRLESTDPTFGGADAITTGNGTDVVIGGAAGDLVRSGAGDDVVLGDHGGFDLVVIDGVLRGYHVTSTYNAIGGNDRIYGQDGDDLLIGGTGGDDIDGGAGRPDSATTRRSNASGIHLLAGDRPKPGRRPAATCTKRLTRACTCSPTRARRLPELSTTCGSC